jgi:acetylornithine deacetylase
LKIEKEYMTRSVENALKLASENRERSIRVLSELVRIPSLTGDEGEAQKYLGQLLKTTGATVIMEEPDVEAIFEAYPNVAQYPTHWQHDLILPYADLPTYQGLQSSGLGSVLNYNGRPNVVGVFKGNGGGRSLILNGHIDTVTIEPSHEWTRDPFGAEIEDGRMYGRGTSDMKGGLLAGIMAMIYLRETGVDINGDVTVESVVNEEHAGNGTLDLVRRGFTADGAIVLEPTNNKVAVSHPGGLYWQVTVPGRPRSPGARWQGQELDGVSAIEKLPAVINALLELESKFNATASDDPMEKGRAVFSLVIGTVSGGHYETVTASETVLRGGAYFSPVMGDIGEVMAAMTQAIDDANAGDDFLRDNPARLEFLHHDDSTRQSPQIPLAVALSNSLQARGDSGEIIPGPFACDCRHLVNQGGIPSVIFGPGTIAQAHKPDEHIEIEEYLACIEHLIAFIGSWCNENNDRSFEDAAKEALPI